MSRGLTTAAAAAVQQEVVGRTVAVELLFASGPVRLWAGFGSIEIGGNEFLGIGTLGTISGMEEAADSQSYGLTVGLSGIPSDAIALALAEAYQGRRANVWELLFDRDSGQLILDPILIFRGRMDQMTPTIGTAAQVEITLQNRWVDWERAPNWRNTDEDQQFRHPGDKGMRFVSATTEKEIIWPGKGFNSAAKASGGSLGEMMAAG